MTVDVLIFTGSVGALMKPAGAYRIATELRKFGYTVQVVDDFLHLCTAHDKLWAIIDKFVGATSSKSNVWTALVRCFGKPAQATHYCWYVGNCLATISVTYSWSYTWSYSWSYPWSDTWSYTWSDTWSDTWSYTRPDAWSDAWSYTRPDAWSYTDAYTDTDTRSDTDPVSEVKHSTKGTSVPFVLNLLVAC